MSFFDKRKNPGMKISFLLLVFFVAFSCADKKDNVADINLDCLYSHLSDMQNMLDTAKIGTEDGTFPKKNADNLLQAIEDLKTGISKAKAGMFVLQFEIDNYCVASDKAIAEFMNSYQMTLPVGSAGELLVFGIDKKGYIDFGESAAYGGSNTFTVESWLKYDANFFEFAIGDFIATFSHDGNGVKQGWMINYMGSNLRMTMGMGPQKDRVLEWGKAYPETYGQWMHLAAVYDETAASDQLKMYINGELFFSKTNDIYDGATLQKYQSNTRNLKMYAFMEPEDNNRCMTGYMRKFRLWSKAKSQTEIQTLMNSDVTGTESNLTCAWDFTTVPADNTNIPDKTGKHKAKLVGSYKWKPIAQ